MILQILIAVISIMLVSLIGVVTTQRNISGWIARNINFLTSFSAGIFLVIAINLAKETNEVVGFNQTVLLIIFGILIFILIQKIMPESHHHHGPEKVSNSKPIGRKVLIADALHNITDGIVLVPAFMTSLHLGIFVTVAIIIHETIQEISEFFVLKESGYTTKGALLRNFLVSGSIIIGVLIGFFLSQKETIESILLGLASGSFLYVVFVDLMPHSLKKCESSWCSTSHILASILGVFVMIAITIFTSQIASH
jgi:zinc and cadmium transporter